MTAQRKPLMVEALYHTPPLEPGTAEYVGTENLAAPIRASRRRAPMPWHQVAARFVVFAAMVLVALTYPIVLVAIAGVYAIHHNFIGRHALGRGRQTYLDG